MTPFDSSISPEITRLCIEFGVTRLEMLGLPRSAKVAGQYSDFDLIVEFAPQRSGDSMRRLMGLKQSLEALIGTSVDLVEPALLSDRFFHTTGFRRLLFSV